MLTLLNTLCIRHECFSKGNILNYLDLAYDNAIYVILYVLTYLIYIALYSISLTAGGRLNKKDGLTRYGDSHVKDKTS